MGKSYRKSIHNTIWVPHQGRGQLSGKLTLEVGLKRKVSLQHGEEDRTGRRVHKSKGMEMCECFLGTSVVVEKQQRRLTRQLPQRCKALTQDIEKDKS